MNEPEDIEAYAGFWRRFAAWLIDTVLFWLIWAGAAFLMIASNVLLEEFGRGIISTGLGVIFTIFIRHPFLLIIIASLIYHSLMEASPRQASLGKMVAGIVVTDSHGHPLTLGKAFGRNAAKLLSGLTLLIGFLMIAFTKRKRGLHDEIADCLVLIKKCPAPGEGLVEETSRRRRRTRRIWILIGVSVAVAVIGTSVWYGWGTYGGLERALNRIEMPAGSKVTGTSREGNALCFDVCAHLSRTYSVIGDTKTVETQVAQALRRARYEVFIARPEETGPNDAYSKRYEIYWFVEADEPGTVRVALTIQYA